MLVIGLTGGIATGKSTVAQMLREMGAQVLDADKIAHELTSPEGRAAPAVLERFGTLSRPDIGRVVFRDAQARRDLNAIVHPLVRQEMIDQLAASSAPVAVLDVPLLYEAGMEDMADIVWVVHVPEEVQIERVMARDSLTRDDALRRIRSQMPTEDKLRRADEGIDTSGPFEETRRQVEALWARALHMAGASIVPEAGASAPRRRRSEARRMQQRVLEAQATQEPVLESTRPFEPPSMPWEDTSTLLDMPPVKTFWAKQKPVFWIAAGVLLVALLVVLGIMGVRAVRESQAQRLAEQAARQLEEERLRYRLDYKDAIDAGAAEFGVDPALIAAVIFNESRFDASAVSYLGARGLMQIMPDTGEWIAQRLGEKSQYSFDNMFDPATNVRYGTWYLGYLAGLFDGNVRKMMAGYHAGQNAVLNWLENPEYSSDGKVLETIPYDDTAQYVERVMTSYGMYKKHHYPDPVQAQDDAA